jgi:hypothetical protein
MESISIIPLTLDCSRVLRATHTLKPFQRFSFRREAVETAGDSLGWVSTWLKPGVNETAMVATSRWL